MLCFVHYFGVCCLLNVHNIVMIPRFMESTAGYQSVNMIEARALTLSSNITVFTVFTAVLSTDGARNPTP